MPPKRSSANSFAYSFAGSPGASAQGNRRPTVPFLAVPVAESRGGYPVHPIGTSGPSGQRPTYGNSSRRSNSRRARSESRINHPNEAYCEPVERSDNRSSAGLSHSKAKRSNSNPGLGRRHTSFADNDGTWRSITPSPRTPNLRDVMDRALEMAEQLTESEVNNVLSSIAEDELLTSRYKHASGLSTAMLVDDVVSRTLGKVDSAIRAISKAQQVSLCFVVDTTSSMKKHIEAVKEHTKHIVQQILQSGCKIAGLSFVGYKDWCDGDSHFEVLDFGCDRESFEQFVEGIKATGGGDTPEDVVGGLSQALRLKWPKESGCRVVFHIGDAPPHGRKGGKGHQYHKFDDDFPDGHPCDESLEQLFGMMKWHNLQYYFGKINSCCDAMLEIFSHHFGKKIETHDVSDPATLPLSVTSSIMDSVSHCTVACLDPIPKCLPEMDKIVPRWQEVAVHNATLMAYMLPVSLSDITSMDAFKPEVVPTYIQVAHKPFDAGAVRLAYYGRRLFPRGGGSVRDIPPHYPVQFCASEELVLKEYIKICFDDSLNRSRYLVDLETQTIAAKLAMDFNERLGRTTRASHIKLKYLKSMVVRLETPGGFRYMSLEKKFRDAKMVKYTTNYNFVRVGQPDDTDFQERSALAVSFSHFTYEYTRQYLMVTDIQGIDSKDSEDRTVMLLTDPAIHCSGAFRFGKTNMRQKAINAFFKVHTCNRFCEALGLKDRSHPFAA